MEMRADSLLVETLLHLVQDRELLTKSEKRPAMTKARIIDTTSMATERSRSFPSRAIIESPSERIGYASGATIMLAIRTGMLSISIPQTARIMAPMTRR